MISKIIIKRILEQAPKTNVDLIFIMMIKHISGDYSYNDDIISHILDMIIEPKSIIDITDVNIDAIKPDMLMYKAEDYDIKNIKIASVDNIDCVVKVNYSYTPKGQNDWIDSTSNINFLYHPEILVKR